MDLRCSAQADVITYMRYGSFAASMTGNVIFAGRQMALLQWQAWGDMPPISDNQTPGRSVRSRVHQLIEPLLHLDVRFIRVHIKMVYVGCEGIN